MAMPGKPNSNPKARTANPQDFIDTSVVQELDQKGFFKKLWR